jgi:hypothetical protein
VRARIRALSPSCFLGPFGPFPFFGALGARGRSDGGEERKPGVAPLAGLLSPACCGEEPRSRPAAGARALRAPSKARENEGAPRTPPTEATAFSAHSPKKGKGPKGPPPCL